MNLATEGSSATADQHQDTTLADHSFNSLTDDHSFNQDNSVEQFRHDSTQIDHSFDHFGDA